MANTMEATVRWISDLSFVGTAGSGHSILMGASAGDGGWRAGPSPMELMLLGAGGCSAVDVVLILQRGREDVTDCQVAVHAERAETDPKVFTKIHMVFTVTGNNLDPRKVERAVALSHEKYCSATVMLAKTATVTHEVVVA